MKLNIPCNEEKIAKTVHLSKKAFYCSEAASPLSRFDFLMRQSRYIGRRWWLFQGLLLALVLLLLSASETPMYLQKCLGVTAPLFTVLALPELWKNRSSGAMEVECAAYYSLRQIYAARLTLFMGVDFLLISLFLFGVSCLGRLTVWEILIGFVLPFNVSCCICFFCLYRPASEVLSILLCMAWTLLWRQIVLTERIYRAVSPLAWVGMLALSFLFLFYIVTRGQQNLKRVWENQPLWN